MVAFKWLKENYWLAIILAVAAALRFYRVDFQSLWVDEIASMNDTNPNLTFRQFYDSVLQWEGFGHLYFLLLKYTLLIFGYTITVARLLSGVIGVFSVYAMYLLGRELLSKRAGLFAAAITCVNIFHISYSQEIRPYILFFLFTTLAFYRLSILIRKPTFKHAIYFGIFSGLMINAHFFGLITLFSQALILGFFLINSPSSARQHFFKCSALGGFVAALLVLPAYEPLMRIAEIKSFWIPAPGPDVFTVIFKDFFTKSELQLFVINIIVIFYFVRVFRQRLAGNSNADIIGNKLVFGFLIMFVWSFTSIVVSILKSYLDVPMIILRYFINILPVIFLIIAIGIDLIRNKVAKYAVICCLLIFSFLDIFLIKDYYNTVTKSQFRELTTDIKTKSQGPKKVVAYWSWVFEYFFKNEPDAKVIQKSLDDYVEAMKSNAISQTPFWYADLSSRPYSIKPENEAYLQENFRLQEKLEYFETWANYYVPINGPQLDRERLDLSLFGRATFDHSGNLMFFSNGTVYSPAIALDKGNYELKIRGKSLPENATGERAHFKVKIGSKEIGQFYLDKAENVIPFHLEAPVKGRMFLTYDNDALIDGVDRNAMINGVGIIKK